VQMLSLSRGLYGTACCHVGESESLMFPSPFSSSHFHTMTLRPFSPTPLGDFLQGHMGGDYALI
jgi:hypothetical protein